MKDNDISKHIKDGIANFNHSKINDKNIHQIVSNVLSNQNITSVDLSNNSLTDKSVNDIIQLLIENKNLKNLDINNNKISNNGLESLSSYLKNNTSLLEFKSDSTDTNINQEITNALKMHDKLETGIVNEASDVKQKFIKEYWLPFKENVEQLTEVVKQRTKKRYDLGNRMPSQKTIFAIQNQCLKLTELWYGKGKGNISFILKHFYQMCEYAEITFYNYEDADFYESEDGFVSQINGKSRTELTEKYKKDIEAPFMKQGGNLIYKKHKINDLHVKHIMTKKHADNLLTLDYMKQLTVALINLEQKTLITELQKELNLTEKEALLKTNELKGDSIAIQMLKENNSFVEDWGQIPQKEKQNIWQKFHDLLSNKSDSLMTPELQDFCAHIKNNPNESYNNLESLKNYIPGIDKLSKGDINDMIQTIGVLSGELAVIHNDALEKISLQRYLSHKWQRDSDLGVYKKNKGKVILRKKGFIEESKYRINQMPYKPCHLLALKTDNSEIDNSIKDFEFFIKQLIFINPSNSEILPGENFFDIAQNSLATSSIACTLHGHVSRCDISNLLLFQKSNNPRFIEKLNSSLDVIQVGDNQDGLFLKIESTNPDNPSLLGFIHKLYNHIEESFNNDIHSYIHMAPNCNGSYTIVLAFHAPLKKIIANYFKNIDTKEVFQFKGLPIKLSDKPIDKTKTDGQDYFDKFYAFAAKKGLYNIVNDFLKNF